MATYLYGDVCSATKLYQVPAITMLPLDNADEAEDVVKKCSVSQVSSSTQSPSSTSS